MRSAVIGLMGGSTYTPASADVWFDPSDLTSLRKEITGALATEPVSDGDLFGSMLNKGTLGGWATSTANTARPVVEQSGGARYAAKRGYGSKNLELPPAIVSALDSADFVMTVGFYFERLGTVFSGTETAAERGLYASMSIPGDITFGAFNDRLVSPVQSRPDSMVLTFGKTPSGRYIRKNGAQIASDGSTAGITNSRILLFEGFQDSDGYELRLHNMTINIGSSISNTVRNANEQFIAGKVGISFTST